MSEELTPMMASVIRSNERLERLFREHILDQDGTYTTRQFADLTGLSIDVIQKYCREGDLAAAPIGKGKKASWLILKSENKRIIEEAIENYKGISKSTASRDKIILRRNGVKIKS